MSSYQQCSTWHMNHPEDHEDWCPFKGDWPPHAPMQVTGSVTVSNPASPAPGGEVALPSAVARFLAFVDAHAVNYCHEHPECDNEDEPLPRDRWCVWCDAVDAMRAALRSPAPAPDGGLVEENRRLRDITPAAVNYAIAEANKRRGTEWEPGDYERAHRALCGEGDSYWAEAVRAAFDALAAASGSKKGT